MNTTSTSPETDWCFETFGDPELAQMLAASRSFVNDVWLSPHSGGRWLTFTGKSGLGKTHLAKRIAEQIRANHAGKMMGDSRQVTFFRCRSMKWRSFVDALMSGRWSVVDELTEPHFLFLDDVGDEAAGTREIAFAKLGNLCDARLGKWTVITSNLKLNQIAAIDARIASRMIRDRNVVIHAGNATDYSLRRER